MCVYVCVLTRVGNREIGIILQKYLMFTKRGIEFRGKKSKKYYKHHS